MLTNDWFPTFRHAAGPAALEEHVCLVELVQLAVGRFSALWTFKWSHTLKLTLINEPEAYIYRVTWLQILLKINQKW